MNKKELYEAKKELKQLLKVTYLDGYKDGHDSICPKGNKVSIVAESVWNASASKAILPVVMELLERIQHG